MVRGELSPRFRSFLAALIALPLLTTAATGSRADFFERNLGFSLSGSSGVDLKDFKGRYIEKASLKDKNFAADAALQDKERVLSLTNEYGSIDDPGLVKFTTAVADKLIAAVAKQGVGGFRPKIVIVADPNPAARSTPSGIIVVSHGLLARLESEDQLAFVLGHEMAHVLMRHHDKSWLVKSQRHVIAAGEVGKGMVDGIAAATKSTSRPGTSKDFDNWHLIADGALIASRDVISPAWNRNQEDQADLLGVDIMVAAGYQPREVLKVLKLLEGIEFGVETPERKSAENAYASWGKRVVAQNRGTPLGDAGKFLEKALDEAGKAISGALAESRRTHRSVDERAAQIRDYARREYAKVNAEARIGSYRAMLAEPRTKQTLQNYGQSTLALQKLIQRANAAAAQPAQNGIAAPTERDSYPRLILSQVQFARGDRKGGIASLQTATQGSNPALRAYLVLSETYAKSGDHKSAWQVAESAQKRYQQSEMLLVHRISLHARAGRRNEAQGMAVQCKLEYPALEQACAEAATRGVSSVK